MWVVLFGVMFIMLSCGPTLNNEVYGKNITSREEVFAKAQARYPQPQVENFPLRQALVKFTLREDMVNHPFYVYIFGDTGNVIGYYVAQTAPLNSCNFLSSTEKVEHWRNGGVSITQAPSLDGIYYGGTGATGACDEWFFFDVATDALIKIRGFKFYTTDQPLKVEAKPILVEAVK